MTIFELDIFGLTVAPTYYGLMYAIGFMAGYYIIKKRAVIKPEIMDDLFLYVFLGVVLGGRFGYILFYNLSTYISSPLDIFKVWEGGMSFHGGVLGVLLAMYLFSRKYKLSFLVLADQITLILPIGLGLGRIGNYLNKELLGYSPYNGFLSVDVNGVGYFPSPLLESVLEGFVLYFVLLYFYNKKHNPGQIASLFLIFYGLFRIFVEAFFRMPDSQLGYIFGYFTMGEILTAPMLLIGLYLYFRFKR
ncbi:MAG: prolipoprotein diacylglyceryl transferase [Candidatus Gracilibacteria bacterium]|nr:prolipoprotein diacylglyceryl transferase [Candidatus Gracilibacteria bacterium]